MKRPQRIAGILFAGVVGILALGLSTPALADGEIESINLGTFGLETLKYAQPSAVFRPLDMVGARAGAQGWAMGGANVAGASGIESVGWNPAGLATLSRPAAFADIEWTRSSGTTTGFPDTFKVEGAPLLSLRTYEVNLGAGLRYNMLGAGTATQVSGGRTLSGAVSVRRYLNVCYPEDIVANMVTPEASGFPITMALEGEESGGVDAIAGTVAFDLLPSQLSIGANLNYLNGRLRARNEVHVTGAGTEVPTSASSIDFDYAGISTDLGLQFRREGLGAVGVRFTPAYTLEVTKGRFSSMAITTGEDVPDLATYGRVAGYDMKVPSLLSVGASASVTERVRLAAEYNIQNWSETEVTYRDEFVGREPDPSLPLHDVSSLHIGAEARYFSFRGIGLPVRLGFHTGAMSMQNLKSEVTETVIIEGRPTKVLLPASEWVDDDDVRLTAFAFGFAFEAKSLRYDVSYEVADYTFNRFYFDIPRDDFLNKESIVVEIDRRVTQLRLSASMSF